MINSQAFRKLFPFGFALDTDLKIAFCGRSLDRLIPDSEGLELSDRFSLQRQTGQPTVDTITALFDRPVQLSVKETPLSLAGEFAPWKEGFLFLGSPKIDRLTELSELNLKISDFSPHDGVMSSLFQVQKMEVMSSEALMAAEELAQQERIYRQIVEESNDIILALTQKGEITLANPAATSLLGISAGGSRANDFLSKESRATWDDAAKALAGGAPSVWVELVLQDPRGHAVSVEGHLVRSLADQGESVLGFLRDVSARKSAEHNLAASNEQLRRAQKMEAVGRFAGGIAHDFNNVLGVVIGAASALQEDLPRHDPRSADLEVILASAEKGAALAHQILQFGQRNRTAGGTTELVAQAESLRPILDRIVGSDVELIIRNSTDRVHVELDAIQFEQVLLNLTVNAEYAMSDGGRLSIEIEADPHRNQAIVRVRDSGSGMEPEVLDRIFEPLYSTKPSEDGSGMGLSIVYGIISEAGGRIEVDSKPNLGTGFTIALPLCNENLKTEEPTGALTIPTEETIRAPRRAILIEDQLALLRLTTRALEKIGLAVESFPSITEARAALLAEKTMPDIFVTDVTLPDGNGLDLAEELVREGRIGKVIIMTGNADFDRIDRLTSHFGWALLMKPFRLNQLTKLVTRLLEDE
ncbi:MAG: ATP-binding protein [Myxococcota bacterium]|nr:ATP-binding protein [Myxococcota bacterium]